MTSSNLVFIAVTACVVFMIQCSSGQEWSSWTELPCSRTCGGGRQRKTRICIGGSYCPGLNEIETICNLDICPFLGFPSLTSGNGLLGLQQQWSQWTELPCSKTCGGGIRRQTRVCIGGTNCPGLPKIEAVCNVHPCPRLGFAGLGQLGEWSQWTELPCSATCGGGRRRETRLCIGGFNCPGLAETETVCNTNPCHTGSWGEWTELSCSVTCGGGEHLRTRTCNGGIHCLGIKEIEQVCNVQACPLGLGLPFGQQHSLLHRPLHSWGQWTPWTVCSAACGGGHQRRERVCVGGGGTCLGLPSMQRPCNFHFC